MCYNIIRYTKGAKLLKILSIITILFIYPTYAKGLKTIDGYIKLLSKVTKCRIIITSGHRTKKENKRVGGVPNSLHLKNKARDMYCPNMPHWKLGLIAAKYVNTIIYRTHVHIDLRLPKQCMFKTKSGYRFCKKSRQKRVGSKFKFDL